MPFNSLYHGTKYALEGISEGLAVELAPLGIAVKIVEPGGVRTDFSGRSLDLAMRDDLQGDYGPMLQGAMTAFADPQRQQVYSEPEQIAEVIFAAATDGRDQLRYVAGQDAEAMLADRAGHDDQSYRRQLIDRFGLKLRPPGQS